MIKEKEIMRKTFLHKVKETELKKLYEYDSECNSFIVDIQLQDYRDAYSEWDYSPFVNRDLDDDLIEFLLECSYEIPFRYGLKISCHIMNVSCDPSREERSKTGMHNYFLYQLRKLRNRRIRIAGDIITFLIIGSILLLSGFYLKQLFQETLVMSVLSEGIFVGGWVMLWEMFSAWFFDLKKARIKYKHFRRLSEAAIEYSYDQGG